MQSPSLLSIIDLIHFHFRFGIFGLFGVFVISSFLIFGFDFDWHILEYSAFVLGKLHKTRRTCGFSTYLKHTHFLGFLGIDVATFIGETLPRLKHRTQNLHTHTAYVTTLWVDVATLHSRYTSTDQPKSLHSAFVSPDTPPNLASTATLSF